MGRKLFHWEWLLLASCQGRWRRCGGNLVLCQCLMMGYDRLDAVPDCLSKIDVWGWKNKMFQVPVCIVVSGGGGCCGCYWWWCRIGIGRNSGLNIDQSSAWFIASVAHEGLGSLNLFHPWAHEGLQEPCHAWWVIRDIERGHSGITHSHTDAWTYWQTDADVPQIQIAHIDDYGNAQLHRWCSIFINCQIVFALYWQLVWFVADNH